MLHSIVFRFARSAFRSTGDAPRVSTCFTAEAEGVPARGCKTGDASGGSPSGVTQPDSLTLTPSDPARSTGEAAQPSSSAMSLITATLSVTLIGPVQSARSECRAHSVHPPVSAGDAPTIATPATHRAKAVARVLAFPQAVQRGGEQPELVLWRETLARPRVKVRGHSSYPPGRL